MLKPYERWWKVIMAKGRDKENIEYKMQNGCFNFLFLLNDNDVEKAQKPHNIYSSKENPILSMTVRIE